jgi:phosphoribosyl 1,2-cyclic phosphodiesterase
VEPADVVGLTGGTTTTEVARALAARRTLFTHISHSLEHHETNACLPAAMALAHDGQMLEV